MTSSLAQLRARHNAALIQAQYDVVDALWQPINPTKVRHAMAGLLRIHDELAALLEEKSKTDGP